MNEILDNVYFFTLFDSERHLSSFHSVTMHRIAPSLKDEICLPIIKNRLKTNF